jgi:hypothetical protein
MGKLKAMQYFCRIDETGSFSAATRLAGVPVSSHRISYDSSPHTNNKIIICDVDRKNTVGVGER